MLGKTRDEAPDGLKKIVTQEVFAHWTADWKQGVEGLVEHRGRFGAGYVNEDFALAQQVGLKTAETFPYETAKSFFLNLSIMLSRFYFPGPDRHQIQLHPVDTFPNLQKFYAKLLEKEDASLNFFFDTTKNFSAPDPHWLSRLKIPAIDNIETQTNDQKKELMIKALSCKPIGVSIASNYYGEQHKGSHAEIVSGYNPQTDEFEIKNSWGGEGFFGRAGNFEHAKAKNYMPHVQNIYFIVDPEKPCPAFQ